MTRVSNRRAVAARRPAAALVVLALAGIASTPVAAQRVVVLKAADNARLSQTLAAFRANAPGLDIDVVALPAPAAMQPIAAGPRDVLVTLGPRSAEYVAALPARPAGPVVHCLAPTGADARVPSEPPLEVQLAWLARLMPSVKSVALLYDPAVNGRRAQATAQALATSGYAVVAEPVKTPSALPAALSRVAGHVDALFALPDAMVFTNETSRGLILFSFRNRIPIIGPNDAWVRLGALYAVDWDYAEVGTVCAKLAVRELGAAAGPLPAPPRPRVSVNLRTAEQFRLRWDAATIADVDRRHE